MVNLNTVILGVVALIVIAALAPTGISSINNANTTGWTTDQVTMFGFIALFFIIGLFISYIPKLRGKGKGGD